MPLMNSHIVEECLPFTSLRLDPEDINLSMGTGYVPDAEIQAISDALETEIAGICTPRFLYALFDAEPAGTCEVGVNGISLKTGSVITPYLKDAAGYVLFVATAGYEFEAFQHRIGSQGDILREFLLDANGSAIAEAVVREVCRKVESRMFPLGYGVSHPYSPGYCGWHVTQQQLLFSCLPEFPCGVRLSDSSLMSPIKSVSGIIAYGPCIVKRKYGCELCGKADCYKNRNKLNR